MENVQEIDIEILDKELSPFLYKWTKGDNDGQVCEYESLFKDPTTGIIWINFKGGTRINYDDIQEGDQLEVFEIQEIARTLS